MLCDDGTSALGVTAQALCIVQVPITYVTEMSWVNELMKLAPTILLIAGYVWFTRRTLGGLGGMGGPGSSRGGMGGIFSVGKAPVRLCRSHDAQVSSSSIWRRLVA